MNTIEAYKVGAQSVIRLLQSDSYFDTAIKTSGRRVSYKRDHALLNAYRKLLIAQAECLLRNQ